MHKGFSRPWRLALPLLLVVALWLFGGSLRAAETIPAKPTRYFNDYALTVKPETAEALNTKLEDFEKQTSNQVLVVIYPKMQSEDDVAAYCQRVARSWQVGQAGKRNGAVLFVFMQEHKTNIQVGYGLEGALPDATARDILEDQIKPRFKAGDYDGGLTAGVDSMIAAVKGEYKGSGSTVYERQHTGGNTSTAGINIGGLFFVVLLALFLFSSIRNRRRGGTMYSGGGPTFFPIGFGGGGFGGGSGSSGGGGGDGGGFFSSGGGDFGGGGASGDW